MQVKIYLDVQFLTEWVMDLCVVLLTARITGKQVRPGRAAFAAAVGALAHVGWLAVCVLSGRNPQGAEGWIAALLLVPVITGIAFSASRERRQSSEIRKRAQSKGVTVFGLSGTTKVQSGSETSGNSGQSSDQQISGMPEKSSDNDHNGMPGCKTNLRYGLVGHRAVDVFRLWAAFAASAFLLAGLLQALHPFWQRMFFRFWLAVFAAYAILLAGLKLFAVAKRRQMDLCPVRLYIGDTQWRVMALRDTGNRLQDPWLHRPVSILEEGALPFSLEELFFAEEPGNRTDHDEVDGSIPAQSDDRNAQAACTKTNTSGEKATEWETPAQEFPKQDVQKPRGSKVVMPVGKSLAEMLKFHLIPYHSVGCPSGVLTGLVFTRMVIEGENGEQVVQTPVIGISRGTVSTEKVYQMILHEKFRQ